MAKSTWKGIRTNHCMFQGEIVADPQFNGGHAFLTLRTSCLQKAGGSFDEADQDVLLMVEPGGPVNVVEKHIKAGRKLQAWCQYKSWEANGVMQHAFIVRKFDLGDKPFEGESGNGVPPLPQ